MSVQQVGSSFSIYANRSSSLFNKVSKESTEFDKLKDIFNRILVPLYGSQEDALQKIALNQDRVCYLMTEEQTPVGVVVFKTVLSNEFSQFGIQNSIEIKSLFVVDSENNSGRGLGSILFNKIVEEAGKLQLGHAAFHVTVSETKGESLSFFMRKGFRNVHVWQDRYKAGTKEFLLHCPLENLASKQSAEKAGEIASKALQGTSKSWFKVVPNAHWGDIHALTLLSDGSFVSGSKDNSLLKWSQNGDLLKVVYEVEPSEAVEKDWITAIGVLNDNYWVSGQRNGRISVWDTEGNFVRKILPKLPTLEQHSHELNRRRVNCLATGANAKNPSLFIGFPTMFDEFSLIEGRTVSWTETSRNDWVYCMRPLSEDRILSATACTLQIWKKQQKKWSLEKTVMKEGRRIGRQRPFISGITPLKCSPHLFGLPLFGGQVKLVDVERSEIVREWHEHRDRVWSLAAISEHLMVSGAEDKAVKFWDIRAEKSICTLSHPTRQVHALLALNDHKLVAGTDAEAGIGSNEGASLLFYDTRHLKK